MRGRQRLRRACAWPRPRTNARARSKASSAMPSHRCDHRMWETGTIDSAATRANGVGRTCSAGQRRADDVPRRAGPAHAQHVPGAGRLELCCARCGEHDHLVARLGVRRAAQGRQQVVGVRAVADGRRLLLEAQQPVVGGVRAAIERPMSPPVPISEVTEAISRWSSASSRQVALEPAVAVAGGARS